MIQGELESLKNGIKGNPIHERPGFIQIRFGHFRNI
jgi:hypothetical protein